MRRLFWKIFGWFWGAMVLIGLALYFVVLTTRPDPLPAAWRTTATNGLRTTGEAAVRTLQRGGTNALTEFLQNEGEHSDARYWLFDATGRELTGQPLPDADRPPHPRPVNRHDHDEDHGEGRGGPPFRRGRPPGADDVLRLHEQAQRDGSAVFEPFGPRVMAALPVRGTTGGEYVLAAIMPSPRFGRPAAAPQTQLVGSLVALLLSGLVCLGLVRYLTAPLVRLRTATQQLAAGDLSARTGAATDKRRDEVADLGRDFDTMAARIESLVGAQRQLLGDISHELRSPLARLSMALALARRHAEKAAGENSALQDEMTPALDRIARETTRLNELIGQLLELTRLESGDAASGQSLDLVQLARDVVADAEYEALNKGRSVQFVERASCRVVGTRELLHSALENVVRNAVRHTAPNTTVDVQLDCEDNWAILRVRDYGSGAPEAALPNIFQPFYRVEAARDRDSGGVGLGLAITERAIRSHGGTVRAANAEGGGLIIEMRLPCSVKPANSSSPHHL
jgi:two-component system sensor histidine kinase CpxA